MDARTTVQIEKKILEQMRKRKIYPRETYNEQIKRLMKLEEMLKKKRSLQ